MNIGEIKTFLINKPGYLKEGSKRLRKVLLGKGFVTTVADCKEAVRLANRELRDNIEEELPMDLRVLVYDIETSYNIGKFWRTGYNLNINPGDIIHERAIICISYKWTDSDKVYNLRWDDNQCDKFMLEQFIEVMNEADLLVAHNGDRFDVKWIKTRALKHGLKMMINYPQFDTLKVAKKKFLFNSNKLDYITQFLGFEGKIKTNMQLWDDIILRKDPKAMKDMLDYCDEDVRQLEKIYKILVGWENPKMHLGVLQGKTKQTSPISGGTNLKFIKSVTTNRGTVKMIMEDEDTGGQFEMSERNYQKYLETYK